MVASQGVLGMFPHGSPLANGQIFIDGELRKGGISGILDKISHATRFKKIMKGLQAWLKMELREVRRDKKRQGDT
ncbi:hypothetical protein F2Q68_00019855 [Brassica cretica]|uniref:Uncharacterized protein n=1 Tax=Brassica cretica TaxID=69181 RepID=A0A8S9FSK7_BRACR|nr:hypothetical protein F2Q68_00019855 [Brassica cretica]